MKLFVKKSSKSARVGVFCQGGSVALNTGLLLLPNVSKFQSLFTLQRTLPTSYKQTIQY